MDDLVDQAAAALRSMATSDRDSIAQAILALAESSLAERSDVATEIEPSHMADVLIGLGQIQGGETATDEEVESAFRHFVF